MAKQIRFLTHFIKCILQTDPHLSQVTKRLRSFLSSFFNKEITSSHWYDSRNNWIAI